MLLILASHILYPLANEGMRILEYGTRSQYATLVGKEEQKCLCIVAGGRGGFASGLASSGSPGASFGQTATNVGGQQTVQTSTGFGDGSVNCTASARARSMT